MFNNTKMQAFPMVWTYCRKYRYHCLSGQFSSPPRSHVNSASEFWVASTISLSSTLLLFRGGSALSFIPASVLKNHTRSYDRRNWNNVLNTSRRSAGTRENATCSCKRTFKRWLSKSMNVQAFSGRRLASAICGPIFCSSAPLPLTYHPFILRWHSPDITKECWYCK